MESDATPDQKVNKPYHCIMLCNTVYSVRVQLKLRGDWLTSSPSAEPSRLGAELGHIIRSNDTYLLDTTRPFTSARKQHRPVSEADVAESNTY